MTIKLSMPEVTELKPRITVIGVGGAGGNAVNNMISAHFEGIEFVASNTDAQALSHSLTDRRIQLGVNATQGLGAGARPEIGREAAMEAHDEIMDHLQNSHMVFITAGMGGGTGTGAAPVIAKATRERGILTVAVVTKPFHFEGSRRMNIAELGIEELQNYVDTLIVIPNQNLFRVANEETTFADAFCMADEVLSQGVRGVTDLMVMPGLINLDFADVRSVMHEMGKAMMGTGEAEGANRAIEAAEAAISNPLLEDVSMKGATGLLINVTGGPDMTLMEVDEAANRVREEVDDHASIIFGTSLDPQLEGRLRVSIIATGIEADAMSSTPLMPVLKPETGVARKSYGSGMDLPLSTVESDSSKFRSASATQVTVAPKQAQEEINHDDHAINKNKLATPSHSVPFSNPSASSNTEDGLGKGTLALNYAADKVESKEPFLSTSSERITQRNSPEVVNSCISQDGFIPPKPMEVEKKSPTLEKPEPFAEAAMTNGARTTSGRVGSPSLLERMTGTGRARKMREVLDTRGDVAETQISPATKSVQSSNNEASETNEKTAGKIPQGDVAQSLKTQPKDEDLLDIPAFLRRQAN